jgi:tetratricopeptide (TPR) repeat protein
MKNMKKSIAAIVSLLALSLVCALARTPVQAYISDYYWIAPFYYGYDPFYGSYITAYENGTQANLLVHVYNDGYYPNATVTAVKVLFDWNINYSSTQVPYTILPYYYHDFTTAFTVPSTSVASNLYPHSYRIYVEFNYSTYRSYWSDSGSYFVVYSNDQANAMSSYNELGAKLDYTPYFYSHQGTIMIDKAEAEYSIGNWYYDRGEFATAYEHYQTGLNLYNWAMGNESSYAATYDSNYFAQQAAEVNYDNAEANYYNALTNSTQRQADAALYQSYAYILFGIGFIVVSIGILIYAAKKPKTP